MNDNIKHNKQKKQYIKSMMISLGFMVIVLITTVVLGIIRHNSTPPTAYEPSTTNNFEENYNEDNDDSFVTEEYNYGFPDYIKIPEDYCEISDDYSNEYLINVDKYTNVLLFNAPHGNVIGELNKDFSVTLYGSSGSDDEKRFLVYSYDLNIYGWIGDNILIKAPDYKCEKTYCLVNVSESDVLPLRLGPNSSYDKINVIENGEYVKLDGIKAGEKIELIGKMEDYEAFVLVYSDSIRKLGWVNSEYLVKAPDYESKDETYLIVNVNENETLNMRHGPDTSYEKITNLKRGEVVEIKGKNNDESWTLIYVDSCDTLGWVSSEYLMTEEEFYNSSTESEETIEFSFNETSENTIEITQYLGNSLDIVIPDSINNKPVTGLGYKGLANLGDINTLTLPATFTSFGEDCFEGTYIKESVYFKGNLVNWCTKMGYPGDNSQPLKDGAKLYIDGNFIEDLVIPEGLTDIHGRTFFAYKHLKNIHFSSSVTRIHAWAFIGCENLEELILPDNITRIDYGAFQLCKNLKTVHIGSGLEKVEGDAFYLCSSLTDVYYNGSEEDWSKISFDRLNESLIGATRHYNAY